jgi:hypothetical protein
MRGNCKVISKSSNIHSKRQLTIIQPSYKHLQCIYSSSTQKQASFTVTPLATVRHRIWRGGGGIRNPASCTGCHILHLFLTVALDRCEWSDSRPSRFTPKKEALTRKLDGPQRRSGRFAEEKNTFPLSGFESRIDQLVN